MGKIRILNVSEVKQAFNMKKALKAVQQAYIEKANGEGSTWPMVFHEFEPGKADLDIKSGDLRQEGIYGLKVVSWFGENQNKQLPALISTSLLFDITTGEPKALLNAEPITHYRTGAAAAIGAKYLARKDSKHLVMCGCGHVAPNLVAAALMLFSQLEKVTIVDTLDASKTINSLERFTKEVDQILNECDEKRLVPIVAATNIVEAVSTADIIFTATPSYQPFIKADWVKAGTHLSCIGADMTGKNEIDKELFKGALVFGDDQEQCFAVGECEIPYKEDIIKELSAEIGEVIVGIKTGRMSDHDITIFDSTGIALQDLASAALILEDADNLGLGALLDL